MDVTVEVEGIGDITGICLEGHSTHELGQVYQAAVTIPTRSFFASGYTAWVGKRMKITLPGRTATLDHHGMILNASAAADEDGADKTVLTSYGPDWMWRWRPARDGADAPSPGNYSKPTFFTRLADAGLIMQEVLEQSIDDSDPNAGEGDLWVSIGTAPGGGADVSGAPADYPLTIAQLRAILESTGQLDVIVTPTDTGSGNMGAVAFYNGDYGTDRSATVILTYGTSATLGVDNVAKMTPVIDATNGCNKLYYYLGPKLDDQHWRRLITADDPGLPDPPLTDILTLRAASRTKYGVLMDVQIHDSFDVEANDVPLYWRRWELEQLLRAQERLTLTFQLVREFIDPDVDVGDIIGFQTGADWGGLDSAARVYKRTIGWDTEGVGSMDLDISPNQDSVSDTG